MLLYVISFIAAGALLGLDQWSKYWTDANLAIGETVPFLGPVLELSCVHNYGVAWSLFSGMRWVLVGVTGVIVLAVISVIALRLIRHPLGIVAAFLILSGGIGNLLDRVFLGYVVDMLHFPFWPSYPTFNVADVCVVTGCVLWLIYALVIQEPGKPGKEKEGSPESGADAEGPSAGIPTDPQGDDADWQEKWRKRQQERRGNG